MEVVALAHERVESRFVIRCPRHRSHFRERHFIELLRHKSRSRWDNTGRHAAFGHFRRGPKPRSGGMERDGIEKVRAVRPTHRYGP